MTTTAYSMNRQDATLKATDTLSNGAGTTNCTSFNLGADPSKCCAMTELVLELDNFTATEMPDGTTVSIAVADSADDSSYTTLFTYPTVTASTGIAASVKRTGIPSNCRQYVRYQITLANGTGTAGDCRGVNAVSSLRF